ncbi:PST family polysaccharide transporter [Methylobacterium sp. BE186]|uniref:oligosaccharide flippase family protein n=1 Tax=Methylobacterium sp. BE186 TaxID=2817715 RepID=UPI00285EF9B8|nr:oligosaccharide flippase family protein [Methylobacterium sp. BE186]MDR7038597.1 PST family polysaccharide transporter [Methylobacterium sp. BE186]
MSLRLKAARSLVWTALESGGLSVLSFVTLVVVARLVTPAELGVFTVALGIIQILTLPVEMLFHDALVQRPDTGDEHYDSAFTASLILSLLLSGGCVLSSDAISWLFSEPDAGRVLSVMSLSLIASALGGTLMARQRREFAFRVLALRSLVGRLIGAGIGIIAALRGGGIWSLVAQQIAMAAFASGLLWYFAPHRPRLRIVPRRLVEMMRFGSASLTNTALQMTEVRIFMLMVAAGLGPTAAGYINLAFRIVDMPRDVLAGAASQLALPLFRGIAQDRDALNGAYAEAVSFTCMLSFPIFLGLAACSPEVVELVFGVQWVPAVPYVTVFALLTIFYFPKLYGGELISALGSPQKFTPVLIVSVATIVIGMLSIGTWALWLAVAVWVLRLATSVPVQIALIRRCTGLPVREQLRGIGAPLTAALLMMALVRGLGWGPFADWTIAHRLAAMVLCGALLYTAALFALDHRALRRLIAFAHLGRGRIAPAPSQGVA